MKSQFFWPRPIGVAPISLTGVGMGTPVFIMDTDVDPPILLIQDAANNQEMFGWVQIQIDADLPFHFHSEQATAYRESKPQYGVSIPGHAPIIAEKEKVADNATLLIERMLEFPFAAKQIARFCDLQSEEVRLKEIADEISSTRLSEPPIILKQVNSYVDCDYREGSKIYFQAFLSNNILSLRNYARIRCEALVSRFDAELSVDVRNWAAGLAQLGSEPTAEEMSTFVERIGRAAGIAFAYNSSVGSTGLFSASRLGTLSMASDIEGACAADEARWELCSKFDCTPIERSLQHQYLQVNVSGNFLDLRDWDFSEYADLHSITISIANLAREKGYDGLIWRKTANAKGEFEIVAFSTSVISSIYAAGIYQLNITADGVRTWEPYHVYA